MTTPDEAPIVATVVVPLLQVPPGVASLKDKTDPPLHTVDNPDIAPGTAFIVTVAVA
jgi:hypothetical protein